MIKPQKRVLIVDDDPDFQKALQLWFVRANFEVVLASNGDIAIQIIRESKPMDLVLTDFMMPERNGMELIRVLRQDDTLFKIPIVVMSNNTSAEFLRKAHELGATAYLLKPEGARVIVEKAASLVGSVEPDTSPAHTQPTSTAPVQAMRSSLLALIRLTAQTDGLPTQARNALISAEELVESLFAAVPLSET
jgi:CheY-like chemotaxis protein